jgi:hypothetical protein
MFSSRRTCSVGMLSACTPDLFRYRCFEMHSACLRAETALSLPNWSRVTSKKFFSQKDFSIRMSSSADTFIQESSEEFICPITQMLPVDPVIAEDGHIYEREAITAWLKTKHTSPYTNNAMGTYLIPAVQIKNMIRAMVSAKAIKAVTDDKDAAWLELMQWEKEKDVDLRHEENVRFMKDADNGSVYAMSVLAYRYGKGIGFERNDERRYEYAKRGADLGYIPCIGQLGHAIVKGYGTRVNVRHGIALISEAATGGSQHSCYMMAYFYRVGIGFPRDIKYCKKWAKKALKSTSSRFRNISETQKKNLQKWVNLH